MSAKDQILSAELHGEALLAAKRPELQPLIDHIREAAQARDDVRTECAGTIAGSWFAGTARRGEELLQRCCRQRSKSAGQQRQRSSHPPGTTKSPPP
jgi:hypothetical protein